MYRGNHSTFLFTSNTFWTSIGTLVNLRGSYFDFRCSKSGIEADRQANFHDWMAVYSDLNNALSDLKSESDQEKKFKGVHSS